MRDEYFHLNKELVRSIGQRQTKSYKLIRWNPAKDGWHKMNIDGVVFTMTGNPSAKGVI